MEPTPSPAPFLISRRRDALVAISVVLGLTLVTAAANKSLPLSGKIWPVAFGLVACAACLAGVLAANLLPLGRVQRDVGLPVAARTGFRTGLMSACLTAGFLVMMLHLAGSQLTLFIALPALVSILPGTFIGALVTALVAGNRKTAEESGLSLGDDGSGYGWFALVGALGLAALVSPFFLPFDIFRPRPVSAPEAQPVPALPAAAIAESVALPAKPYDSAERAKAPLPLPQPAAPTFQFTPETGLADAHWSRRELAHTKSIPDADVDFESAVAISPDGRRFAFTLKDQERKVAVLFDLREFRLVKKWFLRSPVQYLCFSPDGKRVFFSMQDSGPAFAVGKDDGNVAELPEVEAGMPSDVQPHWEKEDEVAFPDSASGTRILSLKSLLLTSDEGRSLGKLPLSGSRWHYGTGDLAREAPVPPPKGAVPNWKVATTRCLSIQDPATAQSRLFPEISLSPGSRILGAADGSVLLAIADQRIDVFYFKLREQPGLVCRAELSPDSGPLPEGSPLLNKEQHTRVHAFVYEPLANPLTGDCIGPDRARILGKARLRTWKNNEAEFVLCSVADPIPEDAVIADLHVISGSTNELLELPVAHRWWARPNFSGDGTGTDSGQAAPEKVPEIHRGAFVVEAGSGTAPVWQKSDADAERLHELIRQFVLNHHRKATQGDVHGVASDYAQTVRFFEKGRVSREFILADQQKYHERFQVAERVAGEVRVLTTGASTYKVTYTLESTLAERGKPAELKRSQVVLQVTRSGETFQINSHNPRN